jgi:hypothetical protein
MTKTFAETLLFASVATNAALLLFFAGVFRQMMNAVDVATFKNLTGLLVQYSSQSPFMIIVLNLPFIGAIPYYYFYGFGNWWITLGLGLWLISGSVSKMIKLPVYKAVAALNNDDTVQLDIMRRKINMGNVFQAVMYCVAVVVMSCGVVNVR